MATSTISNTILDPIGSALSGVLVEVRLMPQAGYRISTFTEIARVRRTTTDTTGFWSLALEQNLNITPTNSWYEVTEWIPDAQGGRRVWFIAVGASDQNLLASLVTPAEVQPTVVPAGDVYLTQSSADARYQALGSLGAASPVAVDAAAAAAGVSTSASRQDHKHSTTVGVPVATGDANAAGAATSLSRSDHVHQGVLANAGWTAWTPVGKQLNTPAQTANTSRYIKLGRLVIATFSITFNAAGTAANSIEVSVPFALSVSEAGGSFRYFDSGTTNHAGSIIAGGAGVHFVYDAFGNEMGNADFVIAAGDFIHGTMIYESAA